MRIQESGEMYLETILVLSERLEAVRSIDIAEEMGYSKPSVSRAVKLLKNDEYIHVDSLGGITLTDKGLEIARNILERHHILTECLVRLGVSEEIAAEDACRVEHYISEETFEALKRALEIHPKK
ncbi:MAG: metal-dependent transcriptional regulator [Clostridiales bacterium]|nr:metal-dependent transcriptional regulator [Candidatus Crickella merdequi]